MNGISGVTTQKHEGGTGLMAKDNILGLILACLFDTHPFPSIQSKHPSSPGLVPAVVTVRILQNPENPR
jgi:hypothetical protein